MLICCFGMKNWRAFPQTGFKVGPGWYLPPPYMTPPSAPEEQFVALQERVLRLEQDVHLWRSLCLKLCSMVERGHATLTPVSCPVANADVLAGVVVLQPSDSSYFCRRCRVTLPPELLSSHCFSLQHTQACQVTIALSPKSLYTDKEAAAFLSTCLPENF